MPLDLTNEEAYALMAYGGQEGMEAIQKVIQPVPIPDTPPSTSASRNNEDRYSYIYNLDTEEVSFVDGSEFNTPIPERNTISTTASRDAYPTDWYTTNPEDYSDTRSTCKLVIFRDGEDAGEEDRFYGGSGWLATSNDVVTAGHCIYEHNDYYPERNPWPTYIQVIPSFSESNPQGPYGVLQDGDVEVGGNWVDGADISDDWGIIHLDQNFPSSAGYYTPVIAGEEGGWARVEGYNASENHQQDLRNMGGNILSINPLGIILTDSEYENGMSGGPCMESGQYVMGIVRGNSTYGYGEILKIDTWLYNKIMSYR